MIPVQFVLVFIQNQRSGNTQFEACDAPRFRGSFDASARKRITGEKKDIQSINFACIFRDYQYLGTPIESNIEYVATETMEKKKKGRIVKENGRARVSLCAKM